jgi:hypothetical protein
MPLGSLAASLIGSGVSALGGAFGGAAAGSEKDRAAAAQAQAMAYLKSINVPEVVAQKITLQNPQFVSQFAPQTESAEQMGPSRMEGISSDPRLALAQFQALDRMQQLSGAGLSPEEQAQLNAMRRESSQRGQAKQGQILQEMQARGVAGGGAELAARMAAAQEGAQSEAESGDRLAAMAHERALKALEGSASLAGQVRGQEFGEESQKASAADAIAQFNALQRAAVQQRNIAEANQAAMREADIKQQLEAQRTAAANQQEMYNKQLIQQHYQNEMEKAKIMSAASQQQAQQHQQNAAATAQNWANLGGQLGQGIMGAQQASAKEAADKAAQARDDQRWGDFMQLQRDQIANTQGIAAATTPAKELNKRIMGYGGVPAYTSPTPINKRLSQGIV